MTRKRQRFVREGRQPQLEHGTVLRMRIVSGREEVLEVAQPISSCTDAECETAKREEEILEALGGENVDY